MFQPGKNLQVWLRCAGPSYLLLLWHFKSTLNNPALRPALKLHTDSQRNS